MGQDLHLRGHPLRCPTLSYHDVPEGERQYGQEKDDKPPCGGFDEKADQERQTHPDRAAERTQDMMRFPDRTEHRDECASGVQ